jgi:hypothetical protein
MHCAGHIYTLLAILTVLLVALLPAECSHFPPRITPIAISASSTTKSSSSSSALTSVNGKSKWQVALEEIAPAPGLLGRFPTVPAAVVVGGLSSFLQTGAVMLPIGMVMNGKVLTKEGVKAWLIKGSALSLDWGKVSALFVGGEKLLTSFRGKEDKWNTILGSGLASGLLRIKEGPAAMAQGAMLGAGFVMAIDLMQPESSTSVADSHFAQRSARAKSSSSGGGGRMGGKGGRASSAYRGGRMR